MADTRPAFRVPPAYTPRDTRSNWERTRPTARELRRHALLFLLTLLTTYAAGCLLLAGGADVYDPLLPPAPDDAGAQIIREVEYYFLSVFWTIIGANGDLAAQGLLFSASLLAILAAHEAGHYFACRHHGVDASLPYFIPAPPPLPTGTLGAFIKLRAPVPSRRALFDIAVAGPLAGFAVILPIAFLGVALAVPAPPPPPGASVLYFNEPLLLQLFGGWLGIDLPTSQFNAPFAAAWFGLLVTSLNLIPVGQLDGGHTIYALFGARAHKRLGVAAFAIVCLLAPLGWWLRGVPSNLLYAVLLFVMLRLRHPEPLDDSDRLGGVRLALAVITLIVFALSFQPFPFTVT